MEQVYLEDPSVLQDHHHHQVHHHHDNVHHAHELVDPTLASVHLDQENGAGHEVYTIEHDQMGVVGGHDQGEMVGDLEMQGDEQAHELEDHLQNPHKYRQQLEHHQHQHQHQQQMHHQHPTHDYGHEKQEEHMEMGTGLEHDVLAEASSSYHTHLAGLDEIDKPKISHNRNPGGKNQHGNPVDTDKLRDVLRHYFNVECVTEWKTVLSRLEAEHGISIKRATLGRYLRQFNIGGSRRMNYSKDSAMPLVVDHIRENDPGSKDSPTKVMKDLGKKGIHIKRDLIRLIMQEHFPDGFDQRRRNSKFKKKRLEGDTGEMDDEAQDEMMDHHHHHQQNVAGSLNHHHHQQQQHQLGMLQQQQHHQHHHHHQAALDMSLTGDPATDSARKLEEAQAEAARAIIMNMALQAQMASAAGGGGGGGGYRTQSQQQQQQQHVTRQMQQQAQQHQHLGVDVDVDVGEGSSSGVHHHPPSHHANSSSDARLLQDLADGVGVSGEDPGIDALREEAMRQVAQMEGYRTGEYDEGAYDRVDLLDDVEVEGGLDQQQQQQQHQQEEEAAEEGMGMMGDDTGVEAYPEEGDEQAYAEETYAEEDGAGLEVDHQASLEGDPTGLQDGQEEEEEEEEEEEVVEEDLEGLDPTLAEHAHQ